MKRWTGDHYVLEFDDSTLAGDGRELLTCLMRSVDILLANSKQTARRRNEEHNDKSR